MITFRDTYFSFATIAATILSLAPGGRAAALFFFPDATHDGHFHRTGNWEHLNRGGGQLFFLGEGVNGAAVYGGFSSFGFPYPS
jgi:hypothetical protein